MISRIVSSSQTRDEDDDDGVLMMRSEITSLPPFDLSLCGCEWEKQIPKATKKSSAAIFSAYE
jgi:hypothetical protein